MDATIAAEKDRVLADLLAVKNDITNVQRCLVEVGSRSPLLKRPSLLLGETKLWQKL